MCRSGFISLNLQVMAVMHTYENQLKKAGFSKIAGVDEAGRGPLAGPVVAAAVVFTAPCRIKGINDSKQLLPEKRLNIYQKLISDPTVVYSVAAVSAAEIDQRNILQASLYAMQLAIEALLEPPDHILVDGPHLPSISIPAQAIIKGDERSISIAAASIIAKERRDELMRQLDRLFPGYGFSQHKGYPTVSHLEALERLGPCSEHRRSFRPVREMLERASVKESTSSNSGLGSHRYR